MFVIAEQECPHCAEDKSAEMDLLQEPETFNGLSILQVHSLSRFMNLIYLFVKKREKKVYNNVLTR